MKMYSSVFFKVLIFIFATSLFGIDLSAGHNAESGITYKSLGSNRYYIETFILTECGGFVRPTWQETVYSRCTSNTSAGWTANTVIHTAYVAPNPVPFGGPYSGVITTIGTTNLVSEEVSSVCDNLLNPKTTANTRCRGSLSTTRGYLKSRLSAIITLTSCDWWRLGFRLTVGRNAQNISSNGAGSYTEAFVNTKDFPNNSAPIFNDERRPVTSACLGQQMSYAAGAYDLDGDSLVFELTCTKADSNNCVTYRAGYSASAPIQGAVMDTSTGLLTFTPTSSGKMIISYWVYEYEKCTGKIKAKTLRDIIVNVNTCTNKVPYISNVFNNLQGKAYRDSRGVIHVGAGETISWDETLRDSNSTDSIYVRSNISKALSGASFKIIPTSSKNEIIVRYTWTATTGRNANKIFSTFFNDDVCDYPGNSASSTWIKVGTAININGGKEIGLGDTIPACIGDTITLVAHGATNFTWTRLSGNQLIPGVNWFLDTNPGIDTGRIAKLIVTQNTVLTARATQAKDDCGRIVQGIPLSDTLAILASDSFSIFSVLDTVLCLPDTNYLDIETSKPSGTYTYQWTPIQFLNFDTIANPRIKALKNDQQFNVTVTSDSGCVRVGEVNVLAAPPFPKNSFLTNQDTFLCVGDTINLKLTLGEVDYGSCESTVAPCLGNSRIDSVGKASFVSDSTSLLYPLVYSSQNKSGKMQFLYTANLLKSYGLEKGLITSLGFNVDALPSANATYKDFTIKMSCIWNSTVPAFFTNKMYEVYSPKNYTPVAGWNTHNFDQSYAWDGSSNILVEICWVNTAKKNAHPRMKFYYAGYACARTTTHSTDSNACSQSSGTNSFMLPFTRFGVCTGLKSANYTYKWSSNTTGRTGGFISNTGDDSVQLVLGSNTTRDFKLTISDTLGACSAEISKKVQLISKYNTKPDSVPPFCETRELVRLTSPTPNNVTTPGGKWTGAGIVDSRNGTWDIKKSGVGTFKVFYEITGNGCASKDSTTITFLPVPNGAIQPIDFVCGSKNSVPQHELIGITPGGSFTGTGVNQILQGGAFAYFIEGTSFNTSGGRTDTAVVRHMVKKESCTKDTLIKIPVLAHWDTTYLGVYNNGTPIFTDKFCASAGSDTLAVRGKKPIWRMVDPQNKAAIIDSVNGIFDPALVKKSNGEKVEIEVENNGFCGAKGQFFVDINGAPEVKILTEDFCFKVPGNCVGSNVPTAKQLDTILVRVAKYPYLKIDNSDTATYVDVVNATTANTGWPGISAAGLSRWYGYFWMNYTDRSAHRYCSLPPGYYPLSYRTALSYRPWATDSLCYSEDSVSIFMNNSFVLNLTSTGSLCNDGTVELEAKTSRSGTVFSWKDGSTITKKTVTKPGTYIVSASYKYCDTKDSVTVTSCIGVEEIEANLEALLYPNPARDNVTIEMQSVESQIELQIFTITGQVIDQFEFEPAAGELSVEVNVSSFSKGVYLFKVSEGKESNVYRVIIE